MTPALLLACAIGAALCLVAVRLRFPAGISVRSFKDVWRSDGEIDRGDYILFGVLPFAIHNLAWLVVSASFELSFSPFNYVHGHSGMPKGLSAVVVASALPITWLGAVMTSRRLHSVGLPMALTALFFVPYLDLLLFLALSVASLKETPSSPMGEMPSGRFIPASAWGSGGFVTMAAVFVAAILEARCGLFSLDFRWILVWPFLCGLAWALLHRPCRFAACWTAAFASTTVVWGLLSVLAFQEAAWLVMAFPVSAILTLIWFIMALFGAIFGWAALWRRPRTT